MAIVFIIEPKIIKFVKRDTRLSLLSTKRGFGYTLVGLCDGSLALKGSLDKDRGIY